VYIILYGLHHEFIDEGTLLFYRNGENSGEVHICIFGMILGIQGVINKDFFE
jgi:hypothetical protein